MMNQTGKPYCLSDEVKPQAEATITKVRDAVPNGSLLYFNGGALRNTMFYEAHGVGLPQRDYDLLFIGSDRELFNDNLLAAGFGKGELQRESQQTFEMPCIPEPQSINDYIVLDVMYYTEGDVWGILEDKINFTVNGWAAEIHDFLSPDWRSHMLSLPDAYEDIEAKQLRLNPKQNPAIAYTDIFACLRFMSQGLKPPSQTEVETMLKYLAGFPDEDKFQKNCQKVFGYVGGEAKARELVLQLGITVDIFDYATVKTLGN